MSWSRAAAGFAFLLAAALGGCGFQPLYGAKSDGGPAVDLTDVYLAPLKGRNESLLYNELRDRMAPNGFVEAPRFRLDVSLNITKQPLAFARDQTATRQNVTALVNYLVRDRSNDQIVTSGWARAVAAYNVVKSEFATLAAEEDAERRAVREIGAEIHTRLAVFFRQRS